MFNLQGSEIIVILILALVVLGPEKLPNAVRQFTRTYAELKKMGNGFQSELKSALDEPMREMRETANLVRDAADPKKLLQEAEAEQRLEHTTVDWRRRRPIASRRATTRSRRQHRRPAATRRRRQPPPHRRRLLRTAVTVHGDAAATAATASAAASAATASDRGLRPGTDSRSVGATEPGRGLGDVTTDEQEATPPADDTMTLTEHLGELRMRIIRSALAVTVGMVFIIAFYDPVLDFLLQPYVDLCTTQETRLLRP